MQTKTIESVTTILDVAANLIRSGGRPRKPLGRPRPAQDVEKVSLPQALRDAARWSGATRHALKQAQLAIYCAVDEKYGHWAWDLFRRADYSDAGFIRLYDQEEPDTREVIRAIQRAKRIVKNWT